MTRSHIRLFALLILVAGLAASARPRAETGARLWLRYDVVADADRLRAYRDTIAAVSVTSDSPTGRVIETELRRGLAGLLGREPVFDSTLRARHLLVGTPARTPAVAALGWNAAIDRLGPDGFLIRSATSNGQAVTVITAATDAGLLYGAFHFLRLLQTGAAIDTLEVESRPRIARRVLNHWDNLDGTVERGYAGASLWWPLDEARPDHIDDRIIDYARANASLGINGAVINNVNADPRVLTAPYLRRVAAIAAALRPYGIRVYLSANAAAPRMLEALDSADPLAPAVAAWWRAKADEIYARIPDFGGFVVKANSEGQPGPQDYGRTHADGANVLADALAPHRGIVMWRAFVYNPEVDPDRTKRAYTEFVPLDGRFRANAFVQVKNGPLDFQPREPFHPLFGAMPKTPLMAELQITQEYLGHSNHLAYLAPMWEEFFDADTFARGSGSTVARVVDGTLEAKADTGIAGVANAGRDRNWTGHDFAQANWYAFGRLAWDPGLGAADVADEWIRMTWSQAPEVVAAIKSMMLESREALVQYSMPLGLHHLIGGDHYAPMPENDDPRRLDWTAIYYHRADATAIGFDRTRRGSGAVDQYFAPLRDRWNDPKTTPEALLLWFHRLPWTHRLASGRTVWEEMVYLYDLGVEQTRQFEARWTSLHGRIDDERYQAVLAKLQLQARDAAAWRDKCLRYFQTFSKGTLPPAAADIGDPPLRARMPAGMRIGAALNQAQSDGHDPSGDTIVSRHFGTISPENLLKWELVHPEPERFAFEAADRFVAYGETRGLDVIGHTLIWHHQTPDWVFTGPNGAPADRETLLARMRDHIHTVVGRYRGRIRGWDVVNEALEEDGSLRRSPWLTLIGEDYLARAFAYAHEADPRAELYYNDFNLTKPLKLEGALRIVDDLKARGVRIDGVGEQGHWRIDQPSTAEIDRTLTTIAAAGVTPMITELDVDVLPRDAAMSAELGGERRAAAPGEDPYRDGLPAAVQARLAERYREIFTVLMAHRARLSRVTFWGVTDRDSWLNNFPLRGRINHPLLWDRRGQAKPAFAAVVAALNAPSR